MLLERNLGKSKLLTLLTARVKNGIWRKKKERMKKKSLVRAAGGIPRAECSASGTGHQGQWPIVYKNRPGLGTLTRGQDLNYNSQPHLSQSQFN